MDYHLDNKVTLSEESQYKSLYKWFLREVGDDVSKHQRDQIPWQWTQYFQLVDVTLTTSYELSDRHGTDDAEFPAVNEREHIKAKLFSGFFGDSPFRRDTSFSMFGTNRALTDISLLIYPTKEDDSEKCAAWGCVSYTTEIDFRYDTTPDTLCFYLYVRPEKFTRIAQKISDPAFKGGSLRVHGVEGFYTDWSPEISTDAIKVLTADKEHAVEIPEGCTIVPPRLGKVAEMELYLRGEKVFALPVAAEPQEDLEDAEDEAPPSYSPVIPPMTPAAPPALDPKVLPLLRSIRAAAWIIAIVMVLLLFKHA